VGLMRSAAVLLLITPRALSAGRASWGNGLPVAGLGQGAFVGLLGGLCVSGLCVGGSCCCWCCCCCELELLGAPELCCDAAAAELLLGHVDAWCSCADVSMSMISCALTTATDH